MLGLRFLVSLAVALIIGGAADSAGANTEAEAACHEAADRCEDQTYEAFERCNERCDQRQDDVDWWAACSDQCVATNDEAVAACDEQREACDAGPQPAPKPAQQGAKPATGLSGSKKAGQEGCYFGECPNDLEKKIETAPPGQPQPQPTSPAPGPNSVPQPQPQPMPTATDTSICQTPTFWCQMGMRGPVGYSCYCNTYMGPVYGVSVPEHR